MTLKLFFGVLSLIPAVIAYFLYFKGMISGSTKPHAFSWLVWGILAGNGFFAQISANAGIGAWTTGLTSLACLSIFFFAIKIGITKPKRFDWILLSLALVSLALLVFVESKDFALGLTIVALVSGFVMTARKAYKRPHEENQTAFVLNTLKFLPAIFALSSFTFLTVAYPLVALLGNATIACLVYFRGKTT